MQEAWLSPHLDARLGKTTDEVLFTNLSYGSRIIAQDDSWEKLRQVALGKPLGEDFWLKRAQAAFLLETQSLHPWPDFVVRLETHMRAYLARFEEDPRPPATSKQELLANLGETELLFREHSMPSPYRGPAERVGPLMLTPVRLVDFMFDHMRAFLEWDLEDRSQDLAFRLVELYFDRPALKHRYEQQYCIPRSSQRRAELMIERLKPGSRVLVLGDDDLVSLALLEFTDALQIDVLELDSDLVRFLKDKGGDRLTVLEHNLRQGVPESMKHRYDAVTTDPPYASDGMRFFLGCAKASLKPNPESRLFLSTFPGLLEDPDRLWKDLKELEIRVLETHHHFSRYIYHNTYRVGHLTALKYLGSPLHPTTELLGFPYLYAHFFECCVPTLP